MIVLVLGGYGHFGALIAATLARAGGFDVVIAGRDRAKAEDLARRVEARAACIDVTDPALGRQVAEVAPRLVINTAGPFQRRDHCVARAAIAAGSHYVDLSDSREYVCAVASLDLEARARDVLVVSGASSVPALSAAVVDRFHADFEALYEVDVGISTSARLPGAATIASVLGSCGRPIPQLREGTWIRGHGGQAIRRRRFAKPAMSRWICDCDVPDLELFPRRYPTLRTVRFGAGVEIGLVQWSYWLLSWMVRAGMIGDVVRWAPALSSAARALQGLGTGRSAMFVTLRGVDREGRARVRNWELAAFDEEGAMVPCMAAIALARKLARGEIAERGAMPCMGLVTLEEYLRELEPWKVQAHETH